MTTLAWICLLFIAYTYFGYALILALLPGRRRTRVHNNRGRQRMSILIAARYEVVNITRKLDLLLRMDYPNNLYEILVGSDGSADGTDSAVCAFNDPRVRLFRYKQIGKTAVLNSLAREATGEILVFMDARQSVNSDVLDRISLVMSDPDVGGVGGELVITDESGCETSAGVGVYWRFEKWLRRRESRLGLLTGLSGALYALRRSLYGFPPDDAILDDVWIPLIAARSGARLVMDEDLKVLDLVADEEREFRRKVRTLVGNWQMLGWIARRPRPFPARLVFSLVSHKVCRLVVPFALVGLLVGSLGMPSGPQRYSMLTGQLLVYGLGLLGLAVRGRLRNPLLSVCSTFCVLNAAAAVSAFQYATGRYRIGWK